MPDYLAIPLALVASTVVAFYARDSGCGREALSDGKVQSARRRRSRCCNFAPLVCDTRSCNSRLRVLLFYLGQLASTRFLADSDLRVCVGLTFGLGVGA